MPNRPVALRRAVSKSEHADIEGMDKLELSSRDCRAVPLFFGTRPIPAVLPLL